MDALIAMMNRPNRTGVLKNSIPKLYIAGKFDPVIPFELSKSEMLLMKNGESILLEHSGHMGFIEEKEKCEDLIIHFLNSLSQGE
jgi:pimeloyl-ACP methyl ester carboxylesterase